MKPVLRVRMTGAPTMRLSDFVFNDMTGQCMNPDDCENTASDEVQLNVEVRTNRACCWGTGDQNQ